MGTGELTAAQQLANQRFAEVAAKIRNDVSRDTVDDYLAALANVTFLSPVNESDVGVEVYVTHFGGDATPLVPVFTSPDDYRAFETVIPPRFRPSIMSSVAMCQMVVECFPPSATLAIDPGKPGFLRVPPDLIRVIASAEWQPIN
jgi:hypothetical protein